MVRVGLTQSAFCWSSAFGVFFGVSFLFERWRQQGKCFVEFAWLIFVWLCWACAIFCLAFFAVFCLSGGRDICFGLVGVFCSAFAMSTPRAQQKIFPPAAQTTNFVSHRACAVFGWSWAFEVIRLFVFRNFCAHLTSNCLISVGLNCGCGDEGDKFC